MSVNILNVDEDALDKHIFKEYNKTKEDLNEYVKIVKKWAETQPHFPEVPNDNLVRFIVLGNKFRIEGAKQKLDMYYTIRSLMPEMYRSVPLSDEVILHSRIVYVVALPQVTSDFKRIVYSQINPNYGPEVFNHERLFESLVNLLELIMLEDKCYNFHYILDCHGFQMGHLTKISPMAVRKFCVVLEKVCSNRVTSLHLVNFAKFMEVILNTIKPALSPKMRDRLKVHSSSDILLDVFGKTAMPKDIGGEEKSLDELTDCLLRIYEDRRDRFDLLQTLRVNESLRPTPLVNDDILGYYGNFKKVDVD